MIEFITHYLQNLTCQLKKIDPKIIQDIIALIDKTASQNGVVYIIGNGGSAATASHIANDLSVGLKIRKIANIKAQSLSDNTSVCTAIANDTGYENIFYIQLLDILTRNDLLIAISCSGKSPNIIKAAEYAKNLGTPIVGLTGFDGGDLKSLCDLSFHIETEIGNYGLVEDIHMILDHIIFSYYTNKRN